MLWVPQNALPHTTSQLSTHCPGFQTSGVDDAVLPLDIDLPLFSGNPAGAQPAPHWFMSPETWKVERVVPTKGNTNFGPRELKAYVVKIHRWLTQWVEKGSNPFIHPRLYQTRFPRCILDAYTALSSYLHKTATNEQIVFRIIEDRAKRLVEEHTVFNDSSPGSVGRGSMPLDSLEHLARVQALLMYQLISLYDGDIRLRHLAETHIPVLSSWMKAMVEHAKLDMCLGSVIFISAYEQPNKGLSISDIAHWDNLSWYYWIVAESIRRTWVVVSGTQALYIMVQQGGPTQCQGGMMITACRGVWEAESALAWERMCSERRPELVQMADADKLFAEVTPEDVDEFTMLFLEATFGVEQMERWEAQIRS